MDQGRRRLARYVEELVRVHLRAFWPVLTPSSSVVAFAFYRGPVFICFDAAAHCMPKKSGATAAQGWMLSVHPP